MAAPKVVLRVDASLHLASGHVMRCLTLAKMIRQQGGECTFVCRELEGNMIKVLAAEHMAVKVLTNRNQDICGDFDARLGTTQEVDAAQTLAVISQTDADIVVVDHYALGERWEELIGAKDYPVMAIDDFTDRPHACDILLNQNLGVTAGHYGGGVVPEACEIMAGAQYALLRPEFAAHRAAMTNNEKADHSRRNILVSMGGMDAQNATDWVLQVLQSCTLPKGWNVSVVLGSSAPHLKSIEAAIGSLNFGAELHIDARNMAELMARSDFAIGASGSTSWERCALGLPAIIVSLAPNQDGLAQALVDAGAAKRVALNDSRALADEIECLLSDGVQRNAMACAAQDVTDGLGAQRVASRIAHFLQTTEDG